MRFLADVGVSVSTAEMLRVRGHEAFHLSEELLHRLPDDEILALARRDGRVILTFDLDFGDLLAAGSHPLPSVILFRLHDQTPPSVNRRLLTVISERGEELQAVWLADDGRNLQGWQRDHPAAVAANADLGAAGERPVPALRGGGRS